MPALGFSPRWLRDMSIRRKLALLVTVKVLSLGLVITLAILGMSILASVRAYVGGEGLWAKAQKNAIYSLSKYAARHDEKDFQDYLSHLKVPLGDRKARLELIKPNPDLNLTDQGFLEGQNHPEDVRGMALLFLRFHNFSHIRRAIEIWTEADLEMEKLQALGEEFHKAYSGGPKPPPQATARLMARLDAANDRLTRLENEFSFTMGEAARWARDFLVLVMILGSLLIGVLSVGTAVLVSRSIASGVSAISTAAQRAAQGDLSVRAEVESRDELGRLAEAFNEMAASLARIDELKNNFVATVSHELRTPLTLNLAPLESMQAGDFGSLTPAQRAALDTMHNNVLRLLQMVNGLLDFSKLEAGKMQVKREPTDLGALSGAILDDFRGALAAKNLSLKRHIDGGPGPLQMDRYLFERILFNLVSNAVKFTPSGGTISVELRAKEGQVALEVADTGIGIAENEAKNLFKKFSQAEASSTRRFEGTGLGLALVKECCQLLGGSVSLKSVPGKGSAFSVCLQAPASPPDARPAPQDRSALAAAVLPQGSWGGNGISQDESLPKVLVAEDNSELAAFIARLLDGIARVRAAKDGEEALALVKSWKPDLLLSDVMMPKMDGLALARAIRASPECAATPVVLLTALTGQEDLLRGWDAGADDYLYKPFHPRELQARVRSLLSMVAWRKRSESQRKRQEILEQFTRIASHDLKAPLRRIASYAELLQQDHAATLGAEGGKYLGVIARSAGQMSGMIESLIQFSRLDECAEAFESCDLNQVASQALKILEPQIAELGAKVTLGELPRLELIPSQMTALFQNLLENSLKYRHNGRKPEIRVEASRQGSEWVFRVADNGVGFDPAQRESIFVMFKRLHRENGAEVEGEGMGLAIAKKIVELHGGRIWADSAQGKGSVISFTLPATQQAAVAA